MSKQSKKDNGIYISDDEDISANYSCMYDEPTVLLKIDSKYINPNYLYPDDYELIDALDNLSEDNEWYDYEWYNVTWEGSIELCGQVQYLEHIDSNAIEVLEYLEC